MFWKYRSIKEIKDKCESLYQDSKQITCCFTGHRCQKLPWGFNEDDTRCLVMREKTKIEIENAIKNGYKIFISGMAIGFDMICAEIVLGLKKRYPQIKLIAALPCENQEARWASKYQEIYKNLLEQADSIRCINKTYTPTCMQERNEYMINNSSLVIALFNGQPGGTKKTLYYAKTQGLDIKIIKI